MVCTGIFTAFRAATLSLFVAGSIIVSNAVSPNGTVHVPGDYYANIDTSLNGPAFRAELTALIVNHVTLTYDDLWSVFKTTDRDTGQPNGCNEGQIGDVYSFKCWDSPAEQCGNYKQEGDCFNRCVAPAHTPKPYNGMCLLCELAMLICSICVLSDSNPFSESMSGQRACGVEQQTLPTPMSTICTLPMAMTTGGAPTTRWAMHPMYQQYTQLMTVLFWGPARRLPMALPPLRLYAGSLLTT